MSVRALCLISIVATGFLANTAHAKWRCDGGHTRATLEENEHEPGFGEAGEVFDDSRHVLAPGEKQLSLQKIGIGLDTRRPAELALSVLPYASLFSALPSVNLRTKIAWADYGPCRLTHRLGLAYLFLPRQSNGVQMHLITIPNAWSLNIPSKNSSMAYKLKAALPVNIGRMVFLTDEIQEPATGLFAMTYLKLAGQLVKTITPRHVFSWEVAVIPFAVGKGIASGQFAPQVTLDAALYQPRIKPLHFGLSTGWRYRYVRESFYVGADMHFGNVDLDAMGIFLPDWFALKKYYLYVLPSIDIGAVF